MDNTSQYNQLMQLAIQEGKLALCHGDVPIGAVVALDGRVVSSAHNRREADNDPTAHAEILALKAAGDKLGRWNLSDCTLIVTIEPCVMCAGACVNARIGTVVYGASDIRFGAMGSLVDVTQLALNHKPKIISGVCMAECSELVRDFFRQRRSDKQ